MMCRETLVFGFSSDPYNGVRASARIILISIYNLYLLLTQVLTFSSLNKRRRCCKELLVDSL